MSLQHGMLIRSCKLVHKQDCKTTPLHYPVEKMVLGHTFHNSIFKIYRFHMEGTEVPIIFAMSNDPSIYM
jgi:hypothetical protein